jgi:hypothetical protein
VGVISDREKYDYGQDVAIAFLYAKAEGALDADDIVNPFNWGTEYRRGFEYAVDPGFSRGLGFHFQGGDDLKRGDGEET